jgi:hypothetical protein
MKPFKIKIRVIEKRANSVFSPISSFHLYKTFPMFMGQASLAPPAALVGGIC